MQILTEAKNIIKKFIPPKNINPYEERPQNYTEGLFYDFFGGNKFYGSLPPVYSDQQLVDYWQLRARSSKLFRENPYCRGVLRRLIRNEINTGLTLDSSPLESVLNISAEKADIWAEQRETDFNLWSENSNICDWKEQRTFDKLAADCRMTALISGDCLVVLRINQKTGLPAVDLIDGIHVQTPFVNPKTKNKKIEHGIELDSKNRHVAYWIKQSDGSSKRIPARGEKSGRLISWMVYGTERRLDDVRGEPILSNMIYMLTELDKYRDSEQRAAVINSMLPMFIENEGNLPSGKVADNGAIRKGSEDIQQTDGSIKKWNWAKWLPGMVPQNLPKGQKPVNFNTTRPNVNFRAFEEAIIDTFAWTLEIPPEIARLLFKSNFSASRQANNEFDIYLKDRAKKNGKDIYQPCFQELTIQQALNGDIFEAQEMLDAWRDAKKWREFGAWFNTEWSGLSRPSVDFLKDVNGGAKAVDYGFTTMDQQCRKISNMPYKTVLAKRKREIEEMKKAGVSFASEEDQNRKPIDTVADPSIEPNSAENSLFFNKRLNRFDKKLSEFDITLLEMQEKFEDLEAVANG